MLLSALLILSALSLGVGAYFLFVNSLVPIVLIDTTLVATIVLLVLAYFVAKGIMVAVNIATVLGVIAPIMSALTPQHVSVLSQLLGGGLTASLGLLQLAGFYVFPVTFVVLRIALRKDIVNARDGAN